MSLAYLVLPFRGRRGRDNGLTSIARRTFVDCRAGHIEVVGPFQFALNPSRTQTAVTKLANPFALLIKNLRCGRGLWLPAFRDQALGALFLVPPRPLSERRLRYAALKQTMLQLLM